MNRFKKFRLGFFSLLLMTTLAIPLIDPALRGQALAADPKLVTNPQINQAAASPGTSIRWINAATIDVAVGSQTVRFTTTDIVANGSIFKAVDYSCPGFDSTINLAVTVGRSATEKRLAMGFLTATASQCIATTPAASITLNGTFASPNDANIKYAQTDATTIVRVDGSPGWVFKSTSDPNRFIRVSEQGIGCSDVIVKLANGTFRLFVLRTGGSNSDPVLGDPACEIMNNSDPNSGGSAVTNAPMNVSPPGSESSNAASNSVTPAPDGGGTLEDDSCESKSGAMGWILCPIINLLDGALNWVDSQVQDLLEIDQDKYTNPSLKTAWTSIRNIAYIILVPIMLVMVIGTALGFEMFSAYTIKRALPRMIVAVIFITFSWYICTFLIGFFNAVGGGILGLMTRPFTELMPPSCQNGSLNLSCLFSADNGVNAGNILRSILFLPLAAASIVGILAFLIFFGTTLLIAVGAAFLVLLARQMFIIALLLVAPLAILAWIFPGNDALWKGWWGAFSKLLMMFPLIMLVIGVGRIFATLLNITDGGALDGAILNPIMKLAAYMLPYAFIPFTFKFAGGLFANLAGVVNNKNKGLFDRARKGRAQKYQGFKAGDKGPAFVKRVGRGLGAVVEPGSKKRNLFTQRGRRELMAQQNKLNEMRYGKSERAQATKDNDPMLRMQTYSTEAEARARAAQDWGMYERDADGNLTNRRDADGNLIQDTEGIRTAIAAANATGGFSAQRQNYAARALVATGTGIESTAQLQSMVARVAGDNRTMAADLLGEGNAVTKQVGRHDLAAGFTNQMRMYDAIQNRGGYEAIAGGAPTLTADEEVRNYVQAARDIDAVTAMRDKPQAVTNMTRALNTAFSEAEHRFNTAAVGSADREAASAEMTTLSGVIAKFEQAGSYASSTNIERADNEVIAPTSGTNRRMVVPGPNVDSSGAPIPIIVPNAGRQAVTSQANPHLTEIDPATNRPIPVYVRHPVTGAFIPDADGRPIPVPNPDYNPDVERGYRSQGPAQMRNPDDPNS